MATMMPVMSAIMPAMRLYMGDPANQTKAQSHAGAGGDRSQFGFEPILKMVSAGVCS